MLSDSEGQCSKSSLEMQIESGLYERQAITNNKTSNYHQQLPELQSDLANEILKDPYNFDFLTIQGKAHERSIENALITHIRDFLIELGQGFAFVGSQVPLKGTRGTSRHYKASDAPS